MQNSTPEGHFTTSLSQSDDSRQARANIQAVANALQPIGQVGRERPRRIRNGEPGERTWNRARDAGRAQQVGEAVVREARRERTAELPRLWLDDTEAAIADLVGGVR
jgi:hypothetical protein